MSITLQDLLKLPSLNAASVVAGQTGIRAIVSSISVLEYAQPSHLQDELFHNNDFQGGELVISAFVSIKDDVDAQCACIKRLHEAGEIGLILYYVGIFLPTIDQRLINLADELGFPLICMPQGRMDQRYSEVLQEVMEILLKERNRDSYIVSEMMDRIATLPPHKRSMDSVLRMLSDRTHGSLYIMDQNYLVLNEATWPKKANVEFSTILMHCKSEDVEGAMNMMEIDERCFWIHKTTIQNDVNHIQLFIVKEYEHLESEMIKQIQEVIQLFVNIWSQNHGAVRSDELIRSILNDEPANMRRLSEIMHISVAQIHSMWMLSIPSGKQKETQLASLQKLAEDFLKQHYSIVIAAVIKDAVIIFMGNEIVPGNEHMLFDLFAPQLKEICQNAQLCGSYALANTRSVRHAYMDILAYLQTAIVIYPFKTYLTLQEVRYAKMVKQHIDQGEEHVEELLRNLQFDARESTQKEELLETLCVYLLDGDMRMQKTADLLFVHKNTVKYRIRQLQDKLHSPIHKLPEAWELYLACAVSRFLSQS